MQVFLYRFDRPSRAGRTTGPSIRRLPTRRARALRYSALPLLQSGRHRTESAPLPHPTATTRTSKYSAAAAQAAHSANRRRSSTRLESHAQATSATTETARFAETAYSSSEDGLSRSRLRFPAEAPRPRRLEPRPAPHLAAPAADGHRPAGSNSAGARRAVNTNALHDVMIIDRGAWEAGGRGAPPTARIAGTSCRSSTYLSVAVCITAIRVDIRDWSFFNQARKGNRRRPKSF